MNAEEGIKALIALLEQFKPAKRDRRIQIIKECEAIVNSIPAEEQTPATDIAIGFINNLHHFEKDPESEAEYETVIGDFLESLRQY